MHKILIVDDEEAIRFAMSEYFQMQGYEVDCAQNVSETEALLTDNSYSVVIADLRLEGIYNLGGLEIVKTIRAHSPQTRIIVLTAYGSTEVEKEVRRHGVNAFLHKPKPLADVAQVVYGLVGSSL